MCGGYKKRKPLQKSNDQLKDTDSIHPFWVICQEGEKKMQKYKLTEETIELVGKMLYRIEAVRDFGDVKAGDRGGYIQSEKNLSHDGDCWVSGNALVFGDAQVSGNAWVFDNAKVSGNAWVFGNAWVSGDAEIGSDADYICLKGFGSENRNTTMFRCKDGAVFVVCGCFEGTLDEFAAKVKQVHGDNKYGKEYGLCVELAKVHFEID